MKIDFNAPVKALNGDDRKDDKGDVFRLRDACVLALDRAVEGEAKQIDAKEKYRRGHLAQRIYGAKEPIALDAEDIALIKGLVGKVYLSNLIVAEVWDMLDPKELS